MSTIKFRKCFSKLFSLPLTKVVICFGHVRMYAMPYSYIRFGTKLYRQIVGIQMGTNCAPLVADLFLYCYERDFMDALDNQDDVIEAFNSTRLPFKH